MGESQKKSTGIVFLPLSSNHTPVTYFPGQEPTIINMTTAKTNYKTEIPTQI